MNRHCYRWERTAAVGRVRPWASADVNVRSGMPTAESRRSPFGQLRSLPMPQPSDRNGSGPVRGCGSVPNGSFLTLLTPHLPVSFRPVPAISRARSGPSRSSGRRTAGDAPGLSSPLFASVAGRPIRSRHGACASAIAAAIVAIAGGSARADPAGGTDGTGTLPASLPARQRTGQVLGSIDRNEEGAPCPAPGRPRGGCGRERGRDGHAPASLPARQRHEHGARLGRPLRGRRSVQRPSAPREGGCGRTGTLPASPGVRAHSNPAAFPAIASPATARTVTHAKATRAK